MTCSGICPKCYPVSNPTNFPNGICGCIGCDPCNRCCGPPVIPCTEVTFTVLVSNSAECAFGGSFNYRDKVKNKYENFYEKVKNYNYLKNKKLLRTENPINSSIYNSLKTPKKENTIEDFKLNQNSKIFTLSETNSSNWLYYKKTNFYDFYNNKKVNYYTWDGNNWFFVTKNKDYKIRKQNTKIPFYVIFDDNLNLIKTDSPLLNNYNFKSIFENNIDNNYVVSTGVEAVKEKTRVSNTPVYHQQQYHSSCLHPVEICYTFDVTFSVVDPDGCGVCCPFYSTIFDFGWWCGVYSIGSGCITRTDYSDENIYMYGPVSEDIFDGNPMVANFQLTQCGVDRGISYVFPFTSAVCMCPNPLICGYPSRHLRKKNIHELRSGYRKQLERQRKTPRKFI